ncbi:Lrp/AsnC family transcriptional regulator [Marinomonas sp. 15G1-11]|uniref:Lrp/AsnC family transcriptional regulator n=1 Tax=Marinomonas phaeophyticola TaxID=3004091 RepID=A0ABT4JTF2_9GAMM|nr:Lrp/AsnC family transcriptional regulator [Marinomonas sp. 15G1-11]MCZ2721610.1 Lrp/AsnC family transcriptional regulator [Marinomonas sp. 15G1-11]
MAVVKKDKFDYKPYLLEAKMQNHLKKEIIHLDGIDSRLIELLYENARTPVTELSRAVGMTAPSVNERLKRLEEKGVIAGYRIEVNPTVLGYSLIAIVRMRPLPGKLKALEALIVSIPEFVECDKVTGEDCYIARLYLKDISDLDPILDRFSELADTNTAIVKSTPVKRRLLV